jgi:hypothetical protein
VLADETPMRAQHMHHVCSKKAGSKVHDLSVRLMTKSPKCNELCAHAEVTLSHIQITQDNLRRSDWRAAAGFAAVEFGWLAGVAKISNSSSSDMQARVNNYSRSALSPLKSDIAIKSAIALE